MIFLPAILIVSDIVIPNNIVAAASGKYLHFQTWPVKCCINKLQHSRVENINKYSDTIICSSFQNPFLSHPNISSFSEGLFITSKELYRTLKTSKELQRTLQDSKESQPREQKTHSTHSTHSDANINDVNVENQEIEIELWIEIDFPTRLLCWRHRAIRQSRRNIFHSIETWCVAINHTFTLLNAEKRKVVGQKIVNRDTLTFELFFKLFHF